MKQSYKNQAKLCKSIRDRLQITQKEFAVIVGFKGGFAGAQFVSNIERGRCNIPRKRLSRLLRYVPAKQIVSAILADELENLKAALKIKTKANVIVKFEDTPGGEKT